MVQVRKRMPTTVFTTIPSGRVFQPKCACRKGDYAVCCEDCDFQGQAATLEAALDARDIHSFEHLHRVSLWGYFPEHLFGGWCQITNADGIDLGCAAAAPPAEPAS
jgi:hypothetical protein